MSYSLDGRAVLITGANRGLGRALVDAALARGAGTVYAAGRTPLDHPDDRVIPVALDLTDPDSIAAAARVVPTLDLLVNNAGLGIVGEDLTDADLLLEHLQVNLFGPMLLTNALVSAGLLGRGRVVSVGSIAGLGNLPLMPSYSISKAAALSLAQAQRTLLAPRGIRVHIVLAGPVDTEMSRPLPIDKAAPESVAAAILDGVMRGEEEIFPDPLAAAIGADWESGVMKSVERANAAAVPTPDYTTSFVVRRPPAEVYAIVNDPRGWWDGEVTGSAERVGDEFSYRYGTIHASVQRVAELVPERRVVWEVVKSELDFVETDEPWTGTRIEFDLAPDGDGTRLTLTHRGLVPLDDCYETCSAGWDLVVGRSLRQFIETGEPVAF